MHTNPIFHDRNDAQNLYFARQRGFGNLVINQDEGPLLSHIPFVISQDGLRVAAHITRSNPIARALKSGAVPALLAVQGSDGYISPDWYGIEDQVPTWNYVSVHLRGQLRLLPQTALKGHLEALSGEFEQRLAPKPPWKLDKLAPEALEKMLRMLVPVELEIAKIDATWKLGQNKGEARFKAAKHVADDGFGQEIGALAALMRRA